MTRTTKIVVAVLAGVLLLALLVLVASSLFNPSDTTEGTRSRFFAFPADNLPPGAEALSEGGASTLEEAQATGRLLQVVKEPVAGATLSKNEDALLFYKKSGGNVFSTKLDGSEETRVSQLTVVGIVDVAWAPTKDTTAVSYLDGAELKHFLHAVATSTTSFLPKGITSIGWSASGKELAYTEPGSGGTRVITTSPSGKGARVVYSSVIPDWRVQWVGQSSLLVSTAPSYFIEGLSEFIPPSLKSQALVTRRGLTLLAHPLKELMAASSVNAVGALEPLVFLNAKGVIGASADRGTLTEKCVWNKAGSALYCGAPRTSAGGLPDAWYRGEVVLRDTIVRVDPLTGKTVSLLETEFDTTDLFVDSTETYLFFLDKNDSSLWRLDLKAES